MSWGRTVAAAKHAAPARTPQGARAGRRGLREGGWDDLPRLSGAGAASPRALYPCPARVWSALWVVPSIFGAIGWPDPKVSLRTESPFYSRAGHNSELQKMSVCGTLPEPKRTDCFVYQFSYLRNGNKDSTCLLR